MLLCPAAVMHMHTRRYGYSMSSAYLQYKELCPPHACVLRLRVCRTREMQIQHADCCKLHCQAAAMALQQTATFEQPGTVMNSTANLCQVQHIGI